MKKSRYWAIIRIESDGMSGLGLMRSNFWSTPSYNRIEIFEIHANKKTATLLCFMRREIFVALIDDV